MKHIHILALPLVLFTTVSAWAQIGIGGLANNTIYTTSASFVVTNEAGYSYDARLDGALVPVGVSVPVTAVDYHELFVLRTNTSTLAVTNRLVKFIIRSAERAGTEDGLPPWTPYPAIPSASGEFAGGTFRLLAPAALPQGMTIPVVAWVENSGGHARRVNGSVAAPGQNAFNLFRGVGSGFLSASNAAGSFNYTASIGGLSAAKSILIETGFVWTGMSGTLSGSVNWPANSHIAVTGGLNLAAGATLTIGAGTIVRLSAGVDITNNAAIVINGTREQPVVFAPVLASQPWGGITFGNGAATLTGTGVIFAGSGANPLWFNANGGAEPASHRREQALFFCPGTNSVSLTDAAAIAMAGQLGHSLAGGKFTFNHFLMQHATSGGEFTGSAWIVNDSAFLECPDESVNFVDGDNDALYFKDGTHGFTNTLFGITKDDGVDSGGSGAGALNFQDCWFESTFHEGNSLSGTGKNVTHVHSVFINCGQGLEAGYDGPTGTMIGCLSTANLIGGRFGDNYNWTYNGFLRATNSLLIYNYRNVWGMNWADWTYRIAQMDIRSNLLSAADSLWPANSLWNPATDAARLAEFITGDTGSPVGIGVALRTNHLSAVELTNGIPVRLSRFSTNVVAVDYAVEGTGGTIAAGTLTFQPGETVKKLALAIAAPQNYELLSLRLANPLNAEITGIAQTFTVTPPPVITLIPSNSIWRYLDNGVDQGTAWRAPGFADGGWASGPGRLGFNSGNTGFGTILGSSTNASKIPTTYFRKSFTVGSVAALSSLLLEIYRDDGVVTYLNGAEIYRNNITNGVPVVYASLCTNCSDNGSAIQSATIPLTQLVNGTNVLAAEVHQTSTTSSDLVFDLKLTGYPATPVVLKQTSLGNGLCLYWDDATYSLEESPALTGPWTPVATSGNAHVIQIENGSRYYRLHR